MVEIKQKQLGKVKLKALEDADEPGTFEAYAAVFGNIDSHGDVIVAGAFQKSLADWALAKATNGLVIPIYWSHLMHSDPDYNLGEVLEAVEDARGLKIKGKLDLDNPKAAQVYKLIKSGRLNQLSFAYEVIAYSQGKQDGRDVWFLEELKIHEISLVQIGANQETEVLAVKAAKDAIDGIEAKAGRVLSKKNEELLRKACESLELVLSSLSEGDEKSASTHTEPATSDANEEIVTDDNSEEQTKTASRLQPALLSAELKLLDLDF